MFIDFRYIILFLIILISVKCTTFKKLEVKTQYRCSISDQKKFKIFYPANIDQSYTGIVVLIHGLNLDPKKMDYMAHALNNKGFIVYRVLLKGHKDRAHPMGEIDIKDWHNDVMDTYCKAINMAEKNNIPLHLIGYFLGGTLILDVINSYEEKVLKYDKVILLAPALSLKWYTYIIKWISFLGKEFQIKSFSPENYRFHSSTSIGAYDALFELINRINFRKNLKRPKNVLVVIDDNDEFINSRDLKENIKKNMPVEWRVRVISEKKKTKYPYHLIIDDQALGKDNWNRMFEEMMIFLE